MSVTDQLALSEAPLLQTHMADKDVLSALPPFVGYHL